MKKIKKKKQIGMIVGLFLLVAVLFAVTLKRQELQGKDVATRGFAREVSLKVNRQGSNTTPINNIKFQLEVQNPTTNSWETVTENGQSTGVPMNFITKDGGEIRLLELTLQKLEENYARYTDPAYRFKQVEVAPYYIVSPEIGGSLGKTSQEFHIPIRETANTANGRLKLNNLTNKYLGVNWTLTVTDAASGKPVVGAKVILQHNKNATASGFTDVTEAISGIPLQMTTDEFGKVNLDYQQLNTLFETGYTRYEYANGGYFKFKLVSAPVGYDVPAGGIQASNSNYISTNAMYINNSTITLSPKPQRSLTLQKRDQEENSLMLSGAEFDLEVQTASGGAWTKVSAAGVQNHFTTENGVVKLIESDFVALQNAYGLTASYRFKETKAPNGYEPPTSSSLSPEFKMKETAGTIVVSPDVVQVFNRKLPRELLLEKKDKITGKRLAGVTFVLERQNGGSWAQVGGNYTTNAEGKITLSSSVIAGLADGEYRFRETAGIAGYEPPTAESVTDSFTVTGGTVSKAHLRMTNEPIVKGELYLESGPYSASYKYGITKNPTTGAVISNYFDDHGGKGYATETDGSYGIIRSNDTLLMHYPVKFEDPGKRNFNNIKMEVKAEILNQKGFSDFAVPTNKNPLQNVTLKVPNTLQPSLQGESSSDSEARTVTASNIYTVSSEAAKGDFILVDIEAAVHSTFNGTKLPLHFTIDLVSAEDPATGDTIVFADQPNPELYHYELDTTFPNDTLTVTSQLSMLPKVAGYNAGISSVRTIDFNNLIVGTSTPPQLNTKVASVGYGWRTVPLERKFRYGNEIPNNLGLAVPRGNNQFDIGLEQEIVATLSDGSIQRVDTGSGGALAPISILGYSVPNGQIESYNKSLLPTTYNSISTPNPENYEMTMDGVTKDIHAIVKQPTLFTNMDGYVGTGYFFGISSYLTYPSNPASLTVSRINRSTSDVKEQDYYIKVKGSTYTDNDGDEILNPTAPTITPALSGQTTEVTWKEKDFPGESIPGGGINELERHLVLDKEDATDKSLLTGAKFVLERRTGTNANDPYAEVNIPNFPPPGKFEYKEGQLIFETDDNGQIVFNEEQLQFIYAHYDQEELDVAKYPFRFREVEAPEGYKQSDVEDGGNINQVSGTFVIYEDTISTNRLIVENKRNDDAVTYRKVAANNTNTGLPGAVFELEYSASFGEDDDWVTVDVATVLGLSPEDAKEKLTSSNGTANSEIGYVYFDAADLAKLRQNPGLGQYRLKEIEPPEGYFIANPPYTQAFTLLANDVQRPISTLITDNQYPRLDITKRAKVNGATTTTPIEGAIFELEFSKATEPNWEDWTWQKVEIRDVFDELTVEEVEEQLTSNKQGKVLPILNNATNLYKLVHHPSYGVGQYRLKEISVPEPYLVPDPPYFPLIKVVKEENNYEVYNVTNSDYSLASSAKPVYNTAMTKYIYNEREANLELKTTNKADTAYGYSVVNDEGESLFSPLWTSYTQPATMQELLSPTRAKTASSWGLNTSNNLGATPIGYGKVLRGEEIVVGSRQTAQYATYSSDKPNEYTNWKPQEASLFQFWNPNEGEFLEAGVDYFQEVSSLGTITLTYGVRKAANPYEWTTDAELKALLNQTTVENYDWYPTAQEAQSHGKISAVRGVLTDFADTDEESVALRTINWNLYTKRIANGSIQDISTKKYAQYNTMTRSEIIYQNPDDSSKTDTLKWTENQYTPSSYGRSGNGLNPTSNSTTTSSTQGFTGDSLLILPYYQPTLTKTALDYKTKQVKTEFPLNQFIEWSLKAEFPKPREGTGGMIEPFDLTITDIYNYSNQVKDNFIYFNKSTELNTTPYSEPNFVGGEPGTAKNRSLEWEIRANLAESSIYDLHFVGIPTTITDPNTFANRMYVETYFGEQYAESRVKITAATSAGGTQKYTSTKVLEKSIDPTNPAELEYTIAVYNYYPDGDLRKVNVLDVLPMNGDRRGPNGLTSSVIGNPDFKYCLENMTASYQSGGEIPSELVEFYYTTDYLEADTKANEAFDLVTWHKVSDLPAGAQPEVTAIFATLPDIPTGQRYEINIQLLTYGNETGDRYYNESNFGFELDATGGTGNEPWDTTSPMVETTVLNRRISGNVWVDNDYNGIMDTGEARVPGTEVRLYQYNSNGELEPVSGIDPIVTDAQGHYEFDGLSAGFYKVGFKLPTDYSDYLITRTNVPDADPLLTNKVSQEERIGDYRLTADTVQLPYTEFDEAGNQILDIHKAGINMGILSRPKLDVQKSVWQKDELTGTYEDINGKKVKVGDTIRYKIAVDNQGESEVPLVQIEDELPAGLELNADKKVYLEVDDGEDKLLLEGEGKDFTYQKMLDDDGEEVEPLRYVLTANIGTLKPNEKATIYFDVLVTERAEGKLSNIAKVIADLPPGAEQPTPSEVENCDTPDPNLEKTSNWDDPDEEESPSVGDIITYTLKVTNAAGASTWKNVILTDVLNKEITDAALNYLEYVPNSTIVDGVPTGSDEMWSVIEEGDARHETLSLNLGDFIGSETAVTKTVVFQAKLIKLPPKDAAEKLIVHNQAEVIGKGMDCEDKEVDFTAAAEHELPLDKEIAKARLHIRQVVVDPSGAALVIPESGYVRMFQSEQAQGESLDASAMTQKIKSDVFETTVPIAESFTNFRMPILKDQLFASFDLLVPEYYEYLGSVWTEDLSPLSINEHQQKPTDDDKPLVLPIKENDEYWISVFITPRWSDGEEAPRPYSWGYQTNQFGELKFLEGTRKK